MAWDFDGPPMHGPGAGRYYREHYPAGFLAAECPVSYSHKRDGDTAMSQSPQVYCDGVLVAAEDISPENHQFIGVWRPPYAPVPTPERPYDVYTCPCLQHLWDIGSVILHWQQGHMDIPQYRSLSQREGVSNAHQEES